MGSDANFIAMQGNASIGVVCDRMNLGSEPKTQLKSKVDLILNGWMQKSSRFVFSAGGEIGRRTRFRS